MKKLLSVILAIAIMMTLSISAFAEDTQVTEPGNAETEVSLEITTTYTITIPADFAFTAPSGLSAEKAITAANVVLAKDYAINVAIASDFTLTSTEGANLAYTVKTDAEGEAVTTGATVATFTAAGSQALLFAVVDELEFAGEYADVITFTVSVDSTNA